MEDFTAYVGYFVIVLFLALVYRYVRKRRNQEPGTPTNLPNPGGDPDDGGRVRRKEPTR